jgi:hypothetical protein
MPLPRPGRWFVCFVSPFWAGAFLSQGYAESVSIDPDQSAIAKGGAGFGQQKEECGNTHERFCACELRAGIGDVDKLAGGAPRSIYLPSSGH